jgi:hypothetical protein
MFGSLTGDFSELDRFTEKVAELGKSRGLTALNKALGAEAIVQARDGFREERDPYGAKWAKKVFPDGNKVLRKSGKLYAGWYLSSVGPGGYTLSNREPHAKFTFGTGVFGKSGQPIRPKNGRALRIPGPVKRGVGGRFTSGAAFYASVKGSPQRLTVPLPGRPSPIWMRALKKTARQFLIDRFRK